MLSGRNRPAYMALVRWGPATNGNSRRLRPHARKLPTQTSGPRRAADRGSMTPSLPSRVAAACSTSGSNSRRDTGRDERFGRRARFGGQCAGGFHRWTARGQTESPADRHPTLRYRGLHCREMIGIGDLTYVIMRDGGRRVATDDLGLQVVKRDNLITGEAAEDHEMRRIGLGHGQIGQRDFVEISVAHRPEHIRPIAGQGIRRLVALRQPIAEGAQSCRVAVACQAPLSCPLVRGWRWCDQASPNHSCRVQARSAPKRIHRSASRSSRV